MSAAEVAVERNEARWRLDATNSHIYNSTNVRDVDHMGHEAPSKRGLVVEDSGRQEEGDMFRTNKINMLPLVRLDPLVLGHHCDICWTNVLHVSTH